MKTTGGKTKAPRRPARAVNIFADGHRGIIAVRQASSLKQALEEYFKETLVPKGHTDKKIVGNVLTTSFKGNTMNYVAKEIYQ